MTDDQHRIVLDQIVQTFSALPYVEAIALSGSRSVQAHDELSDFDLYIYTKNEIPLAIRRELAARFAERMEINNQFWETGDEWQIDDGTSFDLMYRDPQWMEEQIHRVLVRHLASVGYSTCFWHNLLNSAALFDRSGWFGRMQTAANVPYPEELRRAIIAKNHPILRENISSYAHQIEKALRRGDRGSVNHRVAALLASYFDILFAVNYLPHVGEKRLLACAAKLPKIPGGMEEDVTAVLRAASIEHDGKLVERIDEMISKLDELLLIEGLFGSR